MSQYEFLNYKPTPNDKWMIGVASVRIFGKVVLRFKHVKTKDGTGDFFTAPSYSVEEAGEKKYLQAFLLDSRSDEEELMSTVRAGYRAWVAVNSALPPSPQFGAPDIMPF